MYDKDNDIERIFTQDSRDKKRTGIGVSKRASRKGYCRGGVKFPSDFLTTKQKRELNGEIKVSNVYDNLKKVPSLGELKKMKNEEVVKILSYIRLKHSRRDIADHFGVTTATVGYYFDKYNIEKVRPVIRANSQRDFYRSIDEVPTWNELKYIKNEKQVKEILIESKLTFGNDKTGKALGVAKSTLHKILTQYDIINTLKDNPDYQTDKSLLIFSNVKTTSSAIRELSEKNNKKKNTTNTTNKDNKDNSNKKEDIIEQLSNLPVIPAKEKITDTIEIDKIKSFVPENLELSQIQTTLKDIIDKMSIQENDIHNGMTDLLSTLNTIQEKVNHFKNSSESAFKMNLNGEYSKDELENRLLGITNILIDENKYKIDITIEEIRTNN